MAVSKNQGPFLGSPYYKAHSMLGSILGPHIDGNYHIYRQITYWVSLNIYSYHFEVYLRMQEL